MHAPVTASSADAGTTLRHGAIGRNRPRHQASRVGNDFRADMQQPEKILTPIHIQRSIPQKSRI